MIKTINPIAMRINVGFLQHLSRTYDCAASINTTYKTVQFIILKKKRL